MNNDTRHHPDECDLGLSAEHGALVLSVKQTREWRDQAVHLYRGADPYRLTDMQAAPFAEHRINGRM